MLKTNKVASKWVDSNYFDSRVAVFTDTEFNQRI